MSDEVFPTVLPVALRIEGVPCLVVGAGPVGTHKASLLVSLGAAVTVVAPVVSEGMRTLAELPTVELRERRFDEADLADVDLVFVATGDSDTDAQIATLARAAHRWVNVVDVTAECSFFLPAVVRDGPVVVAVSTSGVAPALAARLRDRVGAVLGLGTGEMAARLGRWRRDAHRGGLRPSVAQWREALSDETFEFAQRGDVDRAFDTVVQRLAVKS